MINLNRFGFLHAIFFLGLLSSSFNVTAQSWSNQSNMKVARVEATTIDYRDNIYVFNGFKPGIKIANSIEKYNVATKQWSIVGSTSTLNATAVTHNGIVRIGAEVWIVGGRIGSHPGRVSDRVWVYNLNNGKWRRGPDLPVPGAAGGAALVNNKVHWIGGLDPNARCDVANHFVYDLKKPAAGWKNITAAAGMPSPRNHFSTAVVNGIIYVMGGQFGHDGCPGKNTQDTTLVHAFNPANNKWSTKASLPSKNSHTEPGTFVYKNDIYTVGGENAGDKVWKYNPRTNKWSTFKTLPEKLVAPIARIIDGRLIVAGGGAPKASLAVNTVRSILVDKNPPAVASQVEQAAPVTQTAAVVKVEETKPPEPEPGSQTPAGETLISMEAEYFDISSKTDTHQWVHTAIADSSNDDAMITTPDQGDLAATSTKTPMLSYMVYFNHPGKHYIWVRGLGDSNNKGIGNSDSLHVGLNGKISSTAYRIDQFPEKWTWSRHTPSSSVASLNVVNAGVNIVNFWMREDGLAVDKFVITSDPDFVPTKFGPELSDGTSDYTPPLASVVVDSAPVQSAFDAIDFSVAFNDVHEFTPIGNATGTTSIPEPELDGNEAENKPSQNNVGVEEGQIQNDAGAQFSNNLLVEDNDGSVESSDQLDARSVITQTGTAARGGAASVSMLMMLFTLCLLRLSRYIGVTRLQTN